MGAELQQDKGVSEEESVATAEGVVVEGEGVARPHGLTVAKLGLEEVKLVRLGQLPEQIGNAPVKKPQLGMKNSFALSHTSPPVFPCTSS